MKSVGRAFALGLCLLACEARADGSCSLTLDNNNFGRPIDYTDNVREAANINLVERFHFSSKVEALLGGDSAPLPMDIDYVLRQIPNHYRALNAMSKWQLRHQRPPAASYPPVDCYFERAFAFRPEDANLYLLYAIYLHGKKDYPNALATYRRAEALKLDSAELYYNMGLLFDDMQNYADAKRYAEKAYGMGYPLPGLRNRLIRSGQWSEPAAGDASGTQAAPASETQPVKQ